jgi:3-deoxy-manno-octulosonate cytidylyltransferase (CMP-KDO synthetase)
MFRVVIPARHASTRLPGKPLLPIAGEPMILHVQRLALRSGAAEVVIATDDARIRDTCLAAGAMVEMTSADHASGTDRIAEIAARRGWADQDIVVNVQGDEPLLPPALIGQVAGLLTATRGAAMATLATPILSKREFLDPNVVKVVARPDGMALYFSRAPIPWDRDDADDTPTGTARFHGCRRHLGIYAYRVDALLALASTAPVEIERRERLEQLRALAIGLAIVVGDARELPGPGVDTPEDLARADAILREAARR